MKEAKYKLIENYMLECMKDSAHDKEHIYRVLYVALDIAHCEKGVNTDILITAYLLHDIGRKEQYENPELCHAEIGSVKAYKFLIQNGFEKNFAERVAYCIKAHRFRTSNPPLSIEDKILFDADKIDATGTVGIARTIIYKGKIDEPLYTLNEQGEVSDGENDILPSFFQEYKYKLEKLYSKFYTKRGKEIALERQSSAKAFYESMLKETTDSYKKGIELLNVKIE